MNAVSAPGAVALLAAAIRYALGVCALVTPGEMTLPTPCEQWDLSMLLGHLGESMADLEAAFRTGYLALSPGQPPGLLAGQPVETLRDRGAELLCAAYDFGAARQFVVVGGLPMPGGLVACAGAVEIAVHGWDVTAARGGQRPIPAGLARRMMRLCPFLVAGREDRFARPVEVPAQASPCDQLVCYLGRDPDRGRRLLGQPRAG